MSDGWTKTHRKLLSSDLWLSEKFTRGQAWVDLIGLANYRDGYIRKRGIQVPVKRGQVGWSEEKLSERWKWSRGKVRRYLAELQNEQQIEQQTGNITSLITITNYDHYQKVEQQNEQQIKHQTEQQTDSKRYTNKKNNKKKEEKEYIYTPEIIEFVDWFIEEVKKQHPRTCPKNPSIAKYRDTVRLLIEKDKFTIAEIKEAIEKAWTGKYWKWKDQIKSLDGLRRKAGNGCAKFQNLITGIKDNGSPKRPTRDIDEGTHRNNFAERLREEPEEVSSTISELDLKELNL